MLIGTLFNTITLAMPAMFFGWFLFYLRGR